MPPKKSKKTEPTVGDQFMDEVVAAEEDASRIEEVPEDVKLRLHESFLNGVKAQALKSFQETVLQSSAVFFTMVTANILEQLVNTLPELQHLRAPIAELPMAFSHYVKISASDVIQHFISEMKTMRDAAPAAEDSTSVGLKALMENFNPEDFVNETFRSCIVGFLKYNIGLQSAENLSTKQLSSVDFAEDLEKLMVSVKNNGPDAPANQDYLSFINNWLIAISSGGKNNESRL